MFKNVIRRNGQRFCFKIELMNDACRRATTVMHSTITVFRSSSSFSNRQVNIDELNPVATMDKRLTDDAQNVNETNLISVYRKMAKDKNIALDQHQILALKHLDRLSQEIKASPFYSSITNDTIGDDEGIDDVQRETSSSFFSSISSFFARGGNALQAAQIKHTPPKGVYLHGGVGCGKTFCMDLFFNFISTQNKQKVHFHKFMLNIHQQMHQAKEKGIKGDEVLNDVIKNVINQGIIICFDEFQVTDVADALILRRLFTGLLSRGAVIVATSNRPPRDLYLNGLQRDLFLLFIDLLESKCEVVSMWDSDVDYRLVAGVNKARGVYFIGDEGKQDFDASFRDLTKGTMTEQITLMTQGRAVTVPQASLKYRLARFSFNDLCRKAKGAGDYLLIGENFHTVFMEDVPSLTMNDINVVRRFIVFVDAMYESRVKLILQCESNPDGIFKVDLDNQFCDEAFAFDRTRSRLEEMGSDEYLRKRWVGSIPGTNDESINNKNGQRPVASDDRDFQI